MKRNLICALLVTLFILKVVRAQEINVTNFAVQPNSFTDATKGVAKAIEACEKQGASLLYFPEGRYDFWPDEAEERVYYITNTSSEAEYPSKKQRAGLLLRHLKNITIEGNNSLFIFHGKMISWLLDSCENITLQNIRVDYERPGTSEMTIRHSDATGVIADIHPDSKFAIIDNHLVWYGDKWISEHFFAINVDSIKGLNTYSSWEPFRNSKAVKVGPHTVQFMGDFSSFHAAPGSILTIRDHYRDYVGAFHNRSKNIQLKNIHMHYMHGLGIVSQFTENLFFDSVFIKPAEQSGRVIASSADGMQFSGCKGQIMINNSFLSGMHDDGINVHGTHLQIVKKINDHQLRLRFMHDQTYGFKAFSAGDSIAYVHAPSLKILGEAVIKAATLLNPKEMEVEIDGIIPADLKEGDALENISWTPSFTLKNSHIQGTNTRGVLVTTRRKIWIENNTFYRTGMHAILVEDDATGWYESGPVTDMTIQHNVFRECGYNASPNNYVIQISPHYSETLPDHWIHHNIRIKNNTFYIYDYPILSALSTKGLSFTDNQVIRTDFLPKGKKRAAFQFIDCTDIRLMHNQFQWEEKPEISLENMKKGDLKADF